MKHQSSRQARDRIRTTQEFATRIAGRMGRGPDAVRKVLIKHGLRKPFEYTNRWTDEERRTVARMYLQGASNAEIGQAVGRTSRAVAQALTMLRKQQVI